MRVVEIGKILEEMEKKARLVRLDYRQTDGLWECLVIFEANTFRVREKGLVTAVEGCYRQIKEAGLMGEED